MYTLGGARFAQNHPAQDQAKIRITVKNETGVPVQSARIVLTNIKSEQSKNIYRGETNVVGTIEFINIPAGSYSVKAEKIGFFVANINDVTIGKNEAMEIIMNHEHEVKDSVDITYSPPIIDPNKTSLGGEITNREILNIPYPTQRDYRGVLPFISSSVVTDQTGQLHINGSASYQINNQFDGFNITQPGTGTLELRINPDGLRNIDVLTSRYSAEYGKGSGGTLNLTSGMGDDKFRLTGADFFPSFQPRKGIYLNGWTPRLLFSGPIIKNKAWFFNASDLEYDQDVVQELPEGQDRNHYWRVNNLAKAQININSANILTGSFALNRLDSKFSGLSNFNPEPTTKDLTHSINHLSIKNQTFKPGGLILETGIAYIGFHAAELPMGHQPYEMRPQRNAGNYFRSMEGDATRYQAIFNVSMPQKSISKMPGQHEIKFGLDMDRTNYGQYTERRPISVHRKDGSLSRQINFVDYPAFSKSNFEYSGYIQDRWIVSQRLLVEGGLRLDRDTIVDNTLLSPRIATTYLLSDKRETKASFGFGIFYDATNLGMVTHPLNGKRFDTFYATDGIAPVRGPIETMFGITSEGLNAPRYINWSVGIDHKLPAAIYMSANFVERRGSRGFVFLNRGNFTSTRQSGYFELGSDRLDRYEALQLTARKMFKSNYPLFFSYTRSFNRSNAAFEVSIDNPVFGKQAGGPLPWDVPNRLIAWGLLPIPYVKDFDFAYSMDWRSGLPFNVVDENQQLQGSPNSSRFPTYFTMNLHVEKRFGLLGRKWAFRVGVNNITNHENPSWVDNNMDSANFLRFGGSNERAFVGRIRLIGK